MPTDLEALLTRKAMQDAQIIFERRVLVACLIVCAAAVLLSLASVSIATVLEMAGLSA